jgi:hypothetical protein
MRVRPLILSALVVSLAAPAFAEDWIDFVSKDDRFTCNFPGQPKVTETTYTSEYGVALPARVYSAEVGSSRYSMTVADYNYAQKLLAEKAKACDAGPDACKRELNGLDLRIHQDIAGAMMYATGKMIEGRDVKITMLISAWMDRVEGHHLQFTNNADKSRTYASIYMHENKLYIMEGTVPAGSPEPALFQQSLGFIDENGKNIRYSTLYRNGYPAPPRTR